MQTVVVNKWVDDDGTEVELSLAYEVHGENNEETVLLVMGLGSHMLNYHYESVVKPLVEAGYKVIRFDNRDCGRSTFLPKKPADILSLRARSMATNGVGFLSNLFSSSTPEVLDTGAPFPVTPEQDYDITQPLVAQPGKAPLPVSPPHPSLAVSMGIAPPPPHYELSDMAVDAWNLLTALGIRRAHLVGVSMGGMIVQWMSALQPSRVMSQSLIMTSTYNRASALQPSLRFLMRVFLRTQPKMGSPLASWAAYSAQTVRMIGQQDPNKTFNGGMAIEDFTVSLVTYALSGPGALRQMAAIDLSPCRDGLLSWSVARLPTLVMHGDADELVPASNATHMLGLAVDRAAATGTGVADVVRQSDDKVSTAEVRGPLAYTRLHLLHGYGHDQPDSWCALMVPRLVAHFQEAAAVTAN